MSAPVNVFGAEGASTQRPASALVTVSALAPLLARVPEIKFMSVLSPRKVSVFAPAPELDTVESCKGPLPEASIVAPPVVPASANVRVVTSPGPT